jgi:hypothetical protein
MAISIKEYWRSVRALAAKLDPEAAKLDQEEVERDQRVHLERSQKEIWLVSVDSENTGGVTGQVVSARPFVAARWIKDGTHVLATPEQVAVHKAELGKRKEGIEKEEADRKGVPTSKLLEKLTDAVSAQTGGRKGARGE